MHVFRTRGTPKPSEKRGPARPSLTYQLILDTQPSSVHMSGQQPPLPLEIGLFSGCGLASISHQLLTLPPGRVQSLGTDHSPVEKLVSTRYLPRVLAGRRGWRVWVAAPTLLAAAWGTCTGPTAHGGFLAPLGCPLPTRNAELMHILWIKGPGGGVSWGVKCGPRVAGWLEDSGCGSDQWLVESRELVPRSVSDPTNAPRNHLPAASDAPAFPASLQPITLEEEQSRS